MIFLSASIPTNDAAPKYRESMDVMAIRDAVRALATVILPKSKLIWGGHPAITPLIRYVMTDLNLDIQKHVTLYQTEYFKDDFPGDNEYFENIILTPKLANADISLVEMRQRMIENNKFKVGVFIGGMHGVEREFSMFKKYQPTAEVFPVASTGGAAKIIFENSGEAFDPALKNEFAYMSLFRKLFKNVIDL